MYCFGLSSIPIPKRINISPNPNDFLIIFIKKNNKGMIRGKYILYISKLKERKNNMHSRRNIWTIFLGIALYLISWYERTRRNIITIHIYQVILFRYKRRKVIPKKNSERG